MLRVTRYTFAALTNTASAMRNSSRAATASGTSHTKAQSTGWRSTNSTAANVSNCNRKCTRAAPVVAVGRTARGNRTLPTKGPFDVIDVTAVTSVVLTSVHTSRPLMIHTPNLGIEFGESTENANE